MPLVAHLHLARDGYAIYSSVEGEEGACEPLEPRLSFWRFDGKRLVFYIGDEVLEDAEVVVGCAAGALGSCGGFGT